MKIKTGREILNEHNQQEGDADTYLTLEEMIDQELEKAISIPVEKLVSPKTAKEKEFITYVLTEPFNGGWYDVAEFETLEEAKQEYEKKHVAAIMQKTLKAFIMYKKG